MLVLRLLFTVAADGIWPQLTATDPSHSEPRTREHVGCAQRHQGPVCVLGISLTTLTHLHSFPTLQDDPGAVAEYGIQAATGERAPLM